MELKVYAIRDKQLDAFMNPFFLHTHGQATRAFTDQINEKGTQGNHHPEDYDLYYLGNFDDHTGTFTQAKPEQIAIGSNVINDKHGN